ncbi:D-alanyl-D-alanine carboxypeptidase [Lachnospiraceae bacterium JC7]|nr:D-alanyl-D-alanine carboxypeptidase [Lachnospiraceae bacterium JC7]
MKNHNKFIKRAAAEILIAVMATVNVSTITLADTKSVTVEISDNGPVGVSESSSQLTPETSPAAEAANSASNSGTTGSSSAAPSAESSAASKESSENAESSQATQPSGQASESTAESSSSASSTAASAVSAVQSSVKNFLKTELTETPEVNANFMILVDSDSNLIVADKNGETRMNPASMTKVMTLLVACEHLTDLSEKVTITQDIVDYVQKEGASNCGFKAGEKVSVQDLLYGLILPSGADAALALVRHIAGSEEQFVKLMNQKAQELGISETTHYTNCTGLYGAEHYTTAKDMALVMKYAAADPYASAVLATRNYTTKASNKHSNGVSFSNLFLKRIDGQESGGEAMMAKTGYISKAGNCAVSYFTSASGRHYICVTGKTQGAWNVVYAHADLYKKYGK